MIPKAFHTFYQNQHADRWDGLCDALMQTSVRCARRNAFAGGQGGGGCAEYVDESSLIPDLEGCYQLDADPVDEPLRDGLQWFYRMDPASVLAARALEVQSGDRVLDMCAAPGGKSLILAEALSEGGHLTANEWSRARKEKLRSVLRAYLPDEMLSRVRISGHDASKWGLYEPDTYDRILLDAPCSSERHVLHQAGELKKWKPSRSKLLAQRQYSLLCSALLACKPGGRIVYSTCSVSELENDENIRKLIKKKGDTFQCLTHYSTSWGEKTEFGWQILPDNDQHPGWGPMYWTVLEKCSMC